MSDEEKCAAVECLLNLYGKWPTMANNLLGTNRVADKASAARWASYEQKRKAREKALGYTEHYTHEKQRWRLVWMPAFWDTIQEISHDR